MQYLRRQRFGWKETLSVPAANALPVVLFLFPGLPIEPLVVVLLGGAFAALTEALLIYRKSNPVVSFGWVLRLISILNGAGISLWLMA